MEKSSKGTESALKSEISETSRLSRGAKKIWHLISRISRAILDRTIDGYAGWDFSDLHLFYPNILAILNHRRGEDPDTGSPCIPLYPRDFKHSLCSREELPDAPDFLHPHYFGTGVYLLLKILSLDTPQGQQALQIILDHQEEGYPVIYEHLKAYVETLEEEDFKPQINATKIGQISRAGPHNFEEKFESVGSHMSEGSIPVIAAYAGLLGILPVLVHSKSDRAVILDPKTGFTLLCEKNSEDSSWSIETLTPDSEKLRNTQLVLIDDTVKNGGTMRSMHEIMKQYNPESITVDAPFDVNGGGLDVISEVHGED